MKNFSIKSKSVPLSALEEVVERLIPLGLKDVGVNVRSEFRKTTKGFMVSLMPKNSYYTNCSHITNENFDPLYDEGSTMGGFWAAAEKAHNEKVYTEDDADPMTMFLHGDFDMVEDKIEDPPMREALRGSEIVQIAYERGASTLHFTITDAMIRLEFEEPSEMRNWGLKKGYVADEVAIACAKKSDIQKSIKDLLS